VASSSAIFVQRTRGTGVGFGQNSLVSAALLWIHAVVVDWKSGEF
jgi:hypothetical protein